MINISFSYKLVLVPLLLFVAILKVHGQGYTNELLIGTQFPVQIGAGYQVNVGSHFSGRVQAGLLLPPYDKFIIYSMEAFGFNKRYSKALDQSFKIGVVASVTPQYRFGKNYIGLQGMMANLRGSLSLFEAAELLAENKIALPDLSQLPIIPPNFSTQSNLFMLGLTYGRSISFANSRWMLRPEIGFSKIVTSSNQYSLNFGNLDNSPIVQVYYKNLDERLRSYYRQYGYIPSLSLYLAYTFGNSSLLN